MPLDHAPSTETLSPSLQRARERQARPRALVTGASRGLGFALAGFLSELGYDLVLTARGATALERAAASLGGGGAVHALAGDVTDAAHRARLAERVGERLDLLVHNASSLGPSPLPALADVDLTAVRGVLETNVVAPLALTQALLPALERAGGTVVAVSSDAANGGYPGWGVYGASKAALELMARTLAAELERVSVVCVDPGDMATVMHQQAFPGQDISDRPEPEATLPFWAWLLAQRTEDLDGRRFEAQADAWAVAAAGDAA
jgi:NAD(P)-dependent dehydrogenase (short-subunit alcohol dehydrogenase family)